MQLNNRRISLHDIIVCYVTTTSTLNTRQMHAGLAELATEDAAGLLIILAEHFREDNTLADGEEGDARGDLGSTADHIIGGCGSGRLLTPPGGVRGLGGHAAGCGLGEECGPVCIVRTCRSRANVAGHVRRGGRGRRGESTWRDCGTPTSPIVTSSRVRIARELRDLEWWRQQLHVN